MENTPQNQDDTFIVYCLITDYRYDNLPITAGGKSKRR